MVDCNLTILRRDREEVRFDPDSEVDKSDPTFFPEETEPWGDRRPDPSIANPEIRPREGKASTVSAQVTWRDLRIDFQADLIGSLISSLQQIVDTGLGVFSGSDSIVGAIDDVTDQLQGLLSQSRRRVAVHWSLDVKSDTAHPYVFVTHNHDYFAFARSSDGTGNALTMDVRGDSAVRINARKIADLDLFFDEALTDTQTKDDDQECTVIALGGSDHIVTVSAELQVTFAGFRSQIEELIDSLGEIVAAIAATPNDIGEAIGELRKLIEDGGFLEGIENAGQALADKLQEALKAGLENLIKVLKEYRGYAYMEVSGINIAAITEARFESALQLPRDTSAGPADEQPDKPAEPEEEEAVDEASGPSEFAEPAKSETAVLERRDEFVTVTVPKSIERPMMVRRDRFFPNRSLVLLPVYRLHDLTSGKPEAPGSVEEDAGV